MEYVWDRLSLCLTYRRHASPTSFLVFPHSAGAIKLAKELGPGHTIVTILCDLGTKYQGKIFNVEYLKANNLPFPPWLEEAHEVVEVPQVFEPVET